MNNDNTRAYLAYAVLIISALLIVGLFFIEMPRENSNLINTALGFVAGWAGSIVSFYFGASDRQMNRKGDQNVEKDNTTAD
ncbi:hypothetical protein [Acinetobacter sp. MD2(2019)]|uniref:hypothetical protein n=1 Tax=Acinetobacter sp. MD2(2019) TaxID=2605273 RepID=UPI002D1F91AC|nr:hypothetical protein [Acinetobacter sp. MD2(2019)]MEB3753831.1 hypothetical protein [Acinetobacter sp. MD2(2019)]